MANSERSKRSIATIILVLLVVIIAIFWLWNRKQESQLSQVEIGCATIAPTLEARQAINQLLEQKRAEFPNVRPAGSVNIPVYFHIITNERGEGHVSDAVVQSQIDVLNAAFAGTAPVPPATGNATPFKFYLARIDRTVNDAWFEMKFSVVPTAEEVAAKAALQQGGKSALNIYTVRLANRPFGWARWPWDIANGVDGVVVSFSTLPGGSTYSYDQGDTATHEVGHWLGLFHTFEGGCSAPGDFVADTPFQAGPPYSGCPSDNSCRHQPGADPRENYMNYTNDACMYKFTVGQANRMDIAHLTYR